MLATLNLLQQSAMIVVQRGQTTTNEIDNEARHQGCSGEVTEGVGMSSTA